MLFARLLQFLDTYASLAAQPPMGLGQTISATLAPDWDALREQVGGRLFQSTPFAEACFSEPFDSPKCIAARKDYRDEEARTDHPAGYTQTQWETCQATSQQCLLDYRLPDKQDPTTRHKQCFQGSVPSHFIRVQQPSDISAAFKFSKQSQVPLVIKNTGHDYMGRSSAPGSLALWMHNLKDMSYNPAFVPDGCHGLVTPRTAITLGAGVQWGEAYAFAEQHNVTLVGGDVDDPRRQLPALVSGWLGRVLDGERRRAH
ncbi:hypothetical protein NLJ89_g7428 [Agrocybe chaxingu]|uniref:FAD linked oxidase N-terminal domain-containing protein n=1 Tax=Agrocybe chaxingu TaxID=84603 RepID=A0A9W8JWP8_9AGAR|nr:hypothetical protein NLJ89_g7428 [Agrocybe chaxingu]